MQKNISVASARTANVPDIPRKRVPGADSDVFSYLQKTENK
jgi:hypothetical protein